jgi:hypothetical protein
VQLYCRNGVVPRLVSALHTRLLRIRLSVLDVPELLICVMIKFLTT